MTRDPIKDGRNWYSYCENNPVSFFDAEGTVAMAIAPLALAGSAGWVALGILGIVAIIFLVAAVSDHVYYADSNSGRKQTLVSAEASDSENGASAGGETGSQSGSGAGGTADGPWEDGIVPDEDVAGPGWTRHGEKGGYPNPDYPGVSKRPDLNHNPPYGPHWDFQFRKKQFPNRPRKIRVPVGDWPEGLTLK